MITEEQRRALFALREALRLCECADIVVDSPRGVFVSPHPCEWDVQLVADDIDRLLAEHPE